MAGTKIFVSSTCYDLSVLRAELRNFILSLGHEPVMSDYADILYDPRTHTHTSCINEVINCDMMVVIIGSRFGGTSVPQALEQVDLSKLKELSNGSLTINDDTKVSITQLEVLKAVENNIPIYTFIDKKVYYEHEVYEKNKKKPDIIKQIEFPAIEKQDTAQYIFDFINYIRLRTSGNQIFQFERLQDIEDVLKKQWSGYFQKLLCEQRTRRETSIQITHLNEQFEDLKTAIITSIQNVDQREVANGIVRYRKLSEFLYGINCEKSFLCSFAGDMDELLKEKKIVDIRDFDDFVVETNERVIHPRTVFILENGTFFHSRMSKEFFLSLENDWNEFKMLQNKSKELILEALSEIGRSHMLIRYRNEHIEDYCNNITKRFKDFSEDEV